MQIAGARALREDDDLRIRPGGRGEREERPRRRRLEPVGEATRGGRFDRPPGERRTVRITGQPTPVRRRRSPAQEQIAARPDRVALWAFLLGLFLVLVALVTAGAG